MTTNNQLPTDTDPELWFVSSNEICQGGKDYVFNSHWLTTPAAIAAYCPHDGEDYRIHAGHVLEAETSAATRYWIKGFLAGNLPTPSEEAYDFQSPAHAEYQVNAKRFAQSGDWPN